MDAGYADIPGRYGIALTRTGDSRVECRSPVEADKVLADGSLRSAAVLMAIDMACGIASGFGVVPNWSVTADTAVQFVGECRVGPLRVDAATVKAGRTQALAEARVVDEGAGDTLVAVATANHGVLTPSFENRFLGVEIGGTVRFDRPPDSGTGVLEDHFGLAVDPGVVRIPVDIRTRNPWGILHGGLTGLIIDAISSSVGVSGLDDVVMRFLRPVREGPGVARVTEELDRGGRRLLRIELHDEGTDRLAVLAHVVGR